MVIKNIEKYKENNRRKKIIITFMFFVVAIFGFRSVLTLE